MEEAVRGAAHRATPGQLACRGAGRADFARALADPVDLAIASAEIASELRRAADYVRVTVALTVAATDVADALAIAWGELQQVPCSIPRVCGCGSRGV